MMRRRIFATLLLLCFPLMGEEAVLTTPDIRQTMEEMFTYHVETKELSPVVVRRSCKLFLEQFDPNKVYLLKEEVSPFLNLSEAEVEGGIETYRRDEFPLYVKLNCLVQRAIERTRVIREEQEKELLKKGEEALAEPFTISYVDYAPSEEVLKRRIYYRLLHEVKFLLKKRKMTHLSSEIMKKMIQFHEKKAFRFEESYVNKEREEHHLVLHILKAMAKSLDAHTGYYSPKEAYEIRANLKKQICGVGVVLKEDFDGIFITHLIDGGPAQKSGQIEKGDRLVSIGDKRVEILSFDEILEEMKGKEGTTLQIGVEKDSGVTFHVELVREKLTMNEDRLSVSYQPYWDGIIGIVRLPSFYDSGDQVSAEKDLREALKSLRSEGNLLGLVIDMRENSGGFLTQAVKVSGIFIQGGLIVVSKYSDGEVSYARDIDGKKFYDGPLVILTSKASASATEIVAQAVQDYGVALIVGDERTYGKGSMQYQTLTDEKAKAFFKVTVGRYYTASGRSPQIEGVKADLHVPTVFSPYNIGERYLEYPLSNDRLSGEMFHALSRSTKESYSDFSPMAVPYLRPRETKWRQMLGQLEKNSQARLLRSENFQFFLNLSGGKRFKKKGTELFDRYRQQNFGVEDLSLEEGVEIIKDMLYLKR